MTNRVAALAIAGALALGMCGCAASSQSSAGSSSASTASSSATTASSASAETQTDQMWSEDERDATLYVVQRDGKALELKGENYVDIPLDLIPDPDAYYKVVADVTILNGGVAGYVNYPQIKNITSIEEVTADEATRATA